MPWSTKTDCHFCKPHPGPILMDLDCFGSIAPDISLLEDGELVGIITRTDYLACRRAEKEKVAALTGSLL